MPIHNIEEKKRIMLEFGTGDIHISCAKSKADGERMVIFHKTEPRPIGSTAPELHGTVCDDFSVGMVFHKTKSIDAVIDTLREHQAEKFETLAEKEAQSQEDAQGSARVLLMHAVHAILQTCGNSYSNAYTEEWLTAAKVLGAYQGRVIGKIHELKEEWEVWLEKNGGLPEFQNEKSFQEWWNTRGYQERGGARGAWNAALALGKSEASARTGVRQETHNFAVRKLEEQSKEIARLRKALEAAEALVIKSDGLFKMAGSVGEFQSVIEFRDAVAAYRTARAAVNNKENAK